MKQEKRTVEFNHDGLNHKITFTIDEIDFWHGFKSNGKEYDLHYDEDYGDITVYLIKNGAPDYSTVLHQEKI